MLRRNKLHFIVTKKTCIKIGEVKHFSLSLRIEVNPEVRVRAVVALIVINGDVKI